MKFIHIINCLLVFTTIFSEHVMSIDLKSEWQKIKKNSKTLIVESWNKTRDNSQIGSKPGSYLDYPGLDQEKLNKNKILWELYYKCLEELSKNVNINNIFQAKAITTFRSASLSLECELCISPKDLNNKNVWYYSWLGNLNNLSLIKEDNYFRISSLDLSLTIINIDESKSGLYQCKLDNSEAGPYFIELYNDNETVIDIRNTKTDNTIHEDIVLGNLNFKIWNLWTRWSSCSKCDVIGKQIKLGHCFVSLKNSMIIKANRKYNMSMKNYNHEEIQYLETLMNAFVTGLPCKSSLLGLLYHSDKIIKSKATKIMVKNCKVKCNNNDIFEVKDFQGKVKEIYNNSAGIYSPLQTIPELPPKVETSVIIVFLNEHLCITCPGNLNSDAPYEWRLNNQTVVSNKGHITTDTLNRLVIKNITKEDEQIFTCWQIEYLAGIVQIKVTKEFNIAIQEDIHLYGVILILGIFAWVGFKMFIDREAAYS